MHVFAFLHEAWPLVFMLQNRAQAATELLQELNSDVSGNFVEEVGMIFFDLEPLHQKFCDSGIAYHTLNT